MANGLYTNSELIQTIIVDLNDMIKAQMGGQYIQACNIVTQMGQKLVNLKKTVDRDLESKDRYIADLKQQLKDAGIEVIDMTSEELIEKMKGQDGGSNG